MVCRKTGEGLSLTEYVISRCLKSIHGSAVHLENKHDIQRILIDLPPFCQDGVIVAPCRFGVLLSDKAMNPKVILKNQERESFEAAAKEKSLSAALEKYDELVGAPSEIEEQSY